VTSDPTQPYVTRRRYDVTRDDVVRLTAVSRMRCRHVTSVGKQVREMKRRCVAERIFCSARRHLRNFSPSNIVDIVDMFTYARSVSAQYIAFWVFCE